MGCVGAFVLTMMTDQLPYGADAQQVGSAGSGGKEEPRRGSKCTLRKLFFFLLPVVIWKKVLMGLLGLNKV